MVERVKWATLFLILCIGGIFYLYSSNDWVIVEKTMSEQGNMSSEYSKDVSLLTLEGDEIHLSEFNGEKVFVFFFTTWCHVCAEQWIEIKLASGELANMDINIVAINLTKEERKDSVVESYIDNIKPGDIKITLDTKGEAQRYFQVIGIPTSFLINEQGEIEKRTDGLIPADKLIEISQRGM
ncbi:peroxiredoxin family protein [Salipaludibacillus sp. HK11]|uniref:peroxiredoxin family protein n=1 Tax=Salipaludibacillus sp. HK11 TaxID=3394320 RepID=UPI0039FD00D2